MSEEITKQVEDLTRAIEGNERAKAFLDGFKHGLSVRESSEEGGNDNENDA